MTEGVQALQDYSNLNEQARSLEILIMTVEERGALCFILSGLTCLPVQ